MDFTIAVVSDVGSHRAVNQDSYLLRTARVRGHDLCLGIICDGMGGLSSGEVASSSVVKEINTWFVDMLPRLFEGNIDMRPIDDEVTLALHKVNTELANRGQLSGASMGTTVTILLIIDGKYRIYHAGDSRAYLYAESDPFAEPGLKQLTDDDSLAAQMVRSGEMEPEDAAKSAEAHVLVQCIGGSREGVEIHKYAGQCGGGDRFFLCSDGMYGTLTQGEMEGYIAGFGSVSAGEITASIRGMIASAITKGESDNITGMAVRINA